MPRDLPSRRHLLGLLVAAPLAPTLAPVHEATQTISYDLSYEVVRSSVVPLSTLKELLLPGLRGITAKYEMLPALFAAEDGPNAP